MLNIQVVFPKEIYIYISCFPPRRLEANVVNNSLGTSGISVWPLDHTRSPRPYPELILSLFLQLISGVHLYGSCHWCFPRVSVSSCLPLYCEYEIELIITWTLFFQIVLYLNMPKIIYPLSDSQDLNQCKLLSYVEPSFLLALRNRHPAGCGGPRDPHNQGP